MSLKLGLQAVEEQQYARAVDLLEYFCQNCFDYKSQEYLQAKIGLARAYYGLGQREQVVYICQELINSDRLSVRQWAQQWLNAIQATPKYTAEELKVIFNNGRNALREKNYPVAIKFLEEYCQHNHQPQLPENEQAKMGLIQAYSGTKDFKVAVTLCEELTLSHDSLIREWANEKLPSLRLAQNKQKQSKYYSEATYIENHNDNKQPKKPKLDIHSQETIKANYLSKRATQSDIKLKLPKKIGNLKLAIFITLAINFLIIFIPVFSTIGIINQIFQITALSNIIYISLIISLITNIIIFYLSPSLLNTMWEKSHSLRWISLDEVRYHSPEATETIEHVCEQYKIKIPRLGIINDNNPVIFSYGYLPNHTCILASQGLFSYLDEDEIATVYAHELGHIVNKDCYIMTFGYSILAGINLLWHLTKNNQKKMPNFIYTSSTYFLFYLSRIREYYADHFASEVTGNPNALIRSLIKIAYGIVEENKRNSQSNNLLQESRSLTIYDSDQAIPIGITRDGENLDKMITWDIVNPWANWLELNTTHPINGKRIRALNDYTEQLGLQTEYDLHTIINNAKRVDKEQLQHKFILDLLIFYSPLLGIFSGVFIIILLFLFGQSSLMLFSLPFLGFGLGVIIKDFLRHSASQKTKETDIIALIASPYSSPLRSDKVKLSGELIGNEYSNLKIQNNTGIIRIRYVPGLRTKDNLPLNSQVQVIGWFRRGIVPYLDLIELKTNNSQYKTFNRLWNLGIALCAIIIALSIIILARL